MADDSGIDPRYAAQFQRGYDPSVQGTTAPAPPRPRAETPVRLAGGPESAAVRVPDRPVARAHPAAPQPSAAPAASGSRERGYLDPEAPEVEAGEPELRSARRRRPVAEWVLLGFAALQLVGSHAAVWLQGESQNGGVNFGPGLDGVLLFLFTNSFPGPLFVGGLVALLLWIALRATGRASR